MELESHDNPTSTAATDAEEMSPDVVESNDLSVSNSEEHTEHTLTIVHVPVSLEDVYDHGCSASTSDTPILQTKLANVLHKCLKPNTEDETFREIQELDKLRHQLKLKCSVSRHTHLSTGIRSRYNSLVEYLLQKISSFKDGKVQAIRSFENSYFLAHNALPERQINVEYDAMIREKNFISKGLQLTARDAKI